MLFRIITHVTAQHGIPVPASQAQRRPQEEVKTDDEVEQVSQKTSVRPWGSLGRMVKNYTEVYFD